MKFRSRIVLNAGQCSFWRGKAYLIGTPVPPSFPLLAKHGGVWDVPQSASAAGLPVSLAPCLGGAAILDSFNLQHPFPTLLLTLPPTQRSNHQTCESCLSTPAVPTMPPTIPQRGGPSGLKVRPNTVSGKTIHGASYGAKGGKRHR